MTFNVISAGDPVLAAPVMQNWRHVNYGSALLPVNSTGGGVNNTIDLGSSAYKFKDLWIAGNGYIAGNVGVGTVSIYQGLNMGSATGAPVGTMRTTYMDFFANQIENYVGDNDTEAVYVNYNGYNRGTTRFRDFHVCNGKQGTILFVDGSTGNVGICTTAPDKAIEINSATGACMRLTYNDSNGSATYYSDFSVSSGGDLTIAPSGGTTYITGDAIVGTSVWLNVNAGQVQSTTFYATNNGNAAFFSASTIYNNNTRGCALALDKYSGSNHTAYLKLASEGGTDYYLWVDNNGKLEISTNTANIGSTSGTIVGTQS